MEINKEILKKYIEGNASEEEKIMAYQWISAHPEHTKKYLLEKRLYELSLFQMREEAQNSDYPRKGSFRFQKKSSVNLFLAVAASVCLIIAVSSLFYLYTHLSGNSSLQTIYVPFGQLSCVTLNDGTVIELGSNSKISFPAVFDKKKRSVHLSGRAFFKVTKDKKRPFIVSTDEGEIKVTGTSFYVDAIPEQKIFTTSLIEGKVIVQLKENPLTAVHLKPENQASIKNGKLIVQPITDYDEFLWREGILSFKGKNLEEIIEQLSLFYNLRIVFEKTNPESLKKRTFSGKFRQSDGIDYALQILKQKIKFEYKRDEDSGTIFIIQ